MSSKETLARIAVRSLLGLLMANVFMIFLDDTCLYTSFKEVCLSETKKKKKNLSPRWINQMIKLGQVIVTKLCCDLVK